MGCGCHGGAIGQQRAMAPFGRHGRCGGIWQRDRGCRRRRCGQGAGPCRRRDGCGRWRPSVGPVWSGRCRLIRHCRLWLWRAGSVGGHRFGCGLRSCRGGQWCLGLMTRVGCCDDPGGWCRCCKRCQAVGACCRRICQDAPGIRGAGMILRCGRWGVFGSCDRWNRLLMMYRHVGRGDGGHRRCRDVRAVGRGGGWPWTRWQSGCRRGREGGRVGRWHLRLPRARAGPDDGRGCQSSLGRWFGPGHVPVCCRQGRSRLDRESRLGRPCRPFQRGQGGIAGRCRRRLGQLGGVLWPRKGGVPRHIGGRGVRRRCNSRAGDCGGQWFRHTPFRCNWFRQGRVKRCQARSGRGGHRLGWCGRCCNVRGDRGRNVRTHRMWRDAVGRQPDVRHDHGQRGSLGWVGRMGHQQIHHAAPWQGRATGGRLDPRGCCGRVKDCSIRRRQGRHAGSLPRQIANSRRIPGGQQRGGSDCRCRGRGAAGGRGDHGRQGGADDGGMRHQGHHARSLPGQVAIPSQRNVWGWRCRSDCWRRERGGVGGLGDHGRGMRGCRPCLWQNCHACSLPEHVAPGLRPPLGRNVRGQWRRRDFRCRERRAAVGRRRPRGRRGRSSLDRLHRADRRHSGRRVGGHWGCVDRHRWRHVGAQRPFPKGIGDWPGRFAGRAPRRLLPYRKKTGIGRRFRAGKGPQRRYDCGKCGLDPHPTPVTLPDRGSLPHRGYWFVYRPVAGSRELHLLRSLR